jgi:hypothetical protein
MLRVLTTALAIVVVAPVLVAAPSQAAVKKKPVRRKLPSKPIVKPVAAPAPAINVPGGFMTPKAVVLRDLTPAEAEANAIWNVRAALNVAALQCQFSRFLRTVNNYNDMLKHHGEELTGAQTTMLGHFRKQAKTRGASSFDQYTTRTYNSYSTLDAQYRFCDVAGWVGRRVLALPKGQLRRTAMAEARDVRAALAYQALSPGLAVVPMQPVVLAPIEPADEVAEVQR